MQNSVQQVILEILLSVCVYIRNAQGPGPCSTCFAGLRFSTETANLKTFAWRLNLLYN